ncbi:hypothetical protein AM1_5756 [Acaryochloris marina MBIC11017]|uniref:Uncharacterized protein n=1 Tax=Acaryochloris marina (strain MBIC 11017) TaxID=329726 RepID=B0BZF5_ACAM1|nr:hypothetical protein AM1_5756 [Acaryochloris marina MBIC11017]
MGILEPEGSGISLTVYPRPTAPKLTVSESCILRSELRLHPLYTFASFWQPKLP